MATKKQGPSAVASSRYKAARPAPKSSQGGYGHKSSIGGSTDPQGSRKNKVNQKKP